MFDAQRVDPVFSAPKYYMALGWIDHQVASALPVSSSTEGTLTVDYRNEIEKNVDYQMRLRGSIYNIPLKVPAEVADVGIIKVLQHRYFKIHFRNYLIECELFDKKLTTTKVTTSNMIGIPMSILNKSYSSIEYIQSYLKTKKYLRQDILNAIDYINANASLILDKYNIRDLHFVLNPEGKAALISIFNQLNPYGIKMMLLHYEGISGVLRSYRQVAELANVDYYSAANYGQSASSSVHYLWIKNGYDRKYGDWLQYAYSYAHSLLDELNLRNYSFVFNQEGRSAMISIVSKFSKDAIRVIKCKFSTRAIKDSQEITEALGISADMVFKYEMELNSAIRADWNSVKYGDAYFYLRDISDMSLEQLGYVEPSLNKPTTTQVTVSNNWFLTPEQLEAKAKWEHDKIVAENKRKEEAQLAAKENFKRLEELKKIVSSLPAMEARIIVVKYHTGTELDYLQVAAMIGLYSKYTYEWGRKAEETVKSTWDSLGYGNEDYKPYLMAISGSIFGRELLAGTRDLNPSNPENKKVHWDINGKLVTGD